MKAIESIKYYPAITKSYAPKVIVEKAHTAVKPNYEGKAGDIVGCWQWIAKENTQVVTSYGAYWDFYGVFGDLKLDTANATTDLDYNGGKLPSTVTLTQVGNTVKYENVGTPVGYSYKINIPASIEYGWGVAETTLTITVNPAGAGE
ncbi:putative cell surface protein [Bacteroides sp. CAG:462]|nr:putative cell surface protein [Bacteroides sp. CAG:462]